MKKYSLFLFIFLTLSILNLPGVDSSGHISLIEGEVKIVKTDGEMFRGIVNYPLTTGDVILTGSKSKCELQLANGTLLRLDRNSDIKLISLLTESITSKKKISTLKLMSGTIYSMSQIYKNEILQVITPQISVKMENRSINLIRTTQKESSVRVLRGKVGVIYGEQNKTYIKSGQYVIFPRKGKRYDGKISKDDEFLSWNKSINKDFRKLHYGNSKVPEAIYIHSPGIVHFAERFSTKFGTWEYNEYFGYVWKPSDESFKVLSRRPFFDANYVEIDGELVLVPNQAWGWAPVHLGTWFFSQKDGWVWIPGERKFEKLNLLASGFDGFFWNPEIDYFYMNIDTVGLLAGISFRQPAMESLPWERIYYGTEFPDIWDIRNDKTDPPPSDNIIDSSGKTIVNLNAENIKRDWNPDSRIGRIAGIKLDYDSAGNRIKFPELNLTSKNIKNWQKLALKKMKFNSKSNIVSNSKFNSSGAVGLNTSSSTSSSGSQTSSGHFGGGMSGNGNSGGGGSGGGEKN
ncbi:MAG: DUF6600 domain-containing protein [Acidobacteriota bacterium]